jgi:hypothetical protein
MLELQIRDDVDVANRLKVTRQFMVKDGMSLVVVSAVTPDSI